MITEELVNQIHARIREVAAKYDLKDYSGSQITYPSDAPLKEHMSRQNNWEIKFDIRSGQVSIRPSFVRGYDEESAILQAYPQHFAELKATNERTIDENHAYVAQRADAVRQNILGIICCAGVKEHYKSMSAAPELKGDVTVFNSVDDLILSLNALATEQSQKIDLPGKSELEVARDQIRGH